MVGDEIPPTVSRTHVEEIVIHLHGVLWPFQGVRASDLIVVDLKRMCVLEDPASLVFGDRDCAVEYLVIDLNAAFIRMGNSKAKLTSTVLWWNRQRVALTLWSRRSYSGETPSW